MGDQVRSTTDTDPSCQNAYIWYPWFVRLWISQRHCSCFSGRIPLQVHQSQSAPLIYWRLQVELISLLYISKILLEIASNYSYLTVSVSSNLNIAYTETIANSTWQHLIGDSDEAMNNDYIINVFQLITIKWRYITKWIKVLLVLHSG